MNLKSVYVLFGILLGVLLVFGLTQLIGLKKTGTESNWLLPAVHNKNNEVKAGDITRVELERTIPGSDRRETLVFVKAEKDWVMDQPHRLRVQSYVVERLVDQVLSARREKTEITPNLEELGLAVPAVEVTLFKGEQAWKVKVSPKPSGAGSDSVVYAVTEAQPRDPAAVKYNDLENLYKSVNDFRSKDLISASAFSMNGLDLKGAKGTEIALEKASDGLWRFQKPAYGPAEYEGETASGTEPAPKGVTGVRQLLEDVAGLRVENDSDFVAESVPEAELAGTYGLAADKPETVRIQVKVNRPEENQKASEILLLGKKALPKKDDKEEKKDKKDEKKEEKKPAEPDAYFARLENENAVVRLPITKVEPILKVLAGPEILRSRSLVQGDEGRKDKFDVLNLQNSTGLVKLRKPEGSFDWKLYREGGTAQPTEPGAVTDLINLLTEKKQVKTFVDKDEGLGFDKPLAVVSLWVEGIQKEEKKDGDKKDKEEKKDADKKDKEEKKDGDKKDKEEKKDAEKKEPGEPKLKSDKPSVTVTFGNRDRDKGLVYVRREAGGDRTVVTVADSLLDKVTVGPLAFLDRKLPTFSEGFEPAKEVTKLVLQRGGQTWEETQEKAGEKTIWKFLQPKELAGRIANDANVAGVIRDLANLRPERLISEKPSESDLDQLYGLKTPAIKATVTVTKDGKPQDWVYLFGKETDNKTGWYAKQAQRDLVFVVPKAQVEALQADLRDPVVLRFELGKVKSVKLSGWKESAGRVDNLEVEHKGDKKWEAKVPAGFKLDADAMENFTSGLANLRAERFVTPKAGTKTGLDVNEGALRVESVVDGEAKPLQLTIGAEDAEAKGFYFAQSSQSPGDIFLVPKAAFEKARERIAFFAKK